MNNGRKEYTITWYIENYGYCWHKNGEVLRSPEFTGDGLEGTVLTLQLFPKGEEIDDRGYISVFLARNEVGNGPEKLKLKYELSFISKDGLALYSEEIEHVFEKENGHGWGHFRHIDEIHLHRKALYLPQDTLSVRCKIWKGEGNIQKVEQITARTRIGIERISFLHVIENFSALETNQKKTIHIESPSKNGHLSSSLYFSNNPCCEEKIMVEITPSNTNQILSKCVFFFLDTSGSLTKCGEADNRSDDARKDICKLPLSVTKKAMLDKKGEYLPGDKFSLLCECNFSTGIEYEKIEKTLHEVPLVISNQLKKIDHDKGIYAEKLSECPSAPDDLKEIYINQFLTDVELKTKTKSFPAHKNVLCARSPVFKAMFTNNMKEKIINYIQIEDLEDDTVEKLLLFLYSDSLEDLQLESAVKLFYAGDKYGIKKLMVLCSSFLADNITTASASEILLLSDTHNDSDLKAEVEDFIFKHDEQIFGSKEWKNLEQTNPQLALETMHVMYKRKI